MLTCQNLHENYTVQYRHRTSFLKSSLKRRSWYICFCSLIHLSHFECISIWLFLETQLEFALIFLPGDVYRNHHPANIPFIVVIFEIWWLFRVVIGLKWYTRACQKGGSIMLSVDDPERLSRQMWGKTLYSASIFLSTSLDPFLHFALC